MKSYIGIDLGGTNVRVAKISEFGEVLDEIKGPSFGLEGPAKVVANMKALIRKIDGYEECAGIGIGVPGPVDTVNGKMVMATNLPGFENYELAKELTEEFNLPTFLDNDANVAGLAEAMVGAGKGLPVVYYATISTGIGGALIADGKVVSGKSGYAGEIGNLIVNENGVKINALNAGAVENEASGTAITKKAQQIYGKDKIIDARCLFALAREKDPQALAICDQMAKDIAKAFSFIAHVVDPNIFVIGGGIMNAQDIFLDKMKEYYNGMVHVGMRDVDFVRAELKEPGIIGAAMLPKSRGL